MVTIDPVYVQHLYRLWSETATVVVHRRVLLYEE